MTIPSVNGLGGVSENDDVKKQKEMPQVKEQLLEIGKILGRGVSKLSELATQADAAFVEKIDIPGLTSIENADKDTEITDDSKTVGISSPKVAHSEDGVPGYAGTVEYERTVSISGEVDYIMADGLDKDTEITDDSKKRSVQKEGVEAAGLDNKEDKARFKYEQISKLPLLDVMAGLAGTAAAKYSKKHINTDYIRIVKADGSVKSE